AKILTFRGLSASSVDTASVSVGNGRTVLGTAPTSFGTGDDVVIGAMEMEAVGSTRTIVTGADDIRRTGETTGSGNQSGQTATTLIIEASGLYQGLLRYVSTTTAGDQTILNLVRYAKTLITYPTQAQLASSSNWAIVTAVDDTAPGYMPTISTDSGNNPHIAWSSSRTSGTVYYKNKAGGTWNPTLSWGTTYTGVAVDVSPRTDYVSLTRYYAAATNEIQYAVCKD